MAGFWGWFDREGRPIIRAATAQRSAVGADTATRAVTVVGRLDNRRELGRALGVRSAAGDPDQNDVLIGAAYARWGPDCVKHIEGDWAFVLWDESSRRLILARDASGRASLFYHHNRTRGRLWFATSLEAIFAMPGVDRRVNPDYIAQHSPKVQRTGCTPYIGVERLVPGHLLVASTTTTDVSQYWRTDDAPPIRLPSTEAYVDRFTEVFDEAVRCRLTDPAATGVFLSGGLDSAAVATVAAGLLAHHGARLRAFCAVPRFPLEGVLPASLMGDETALAQTVANHAGHIDLQCVRTQTLSVLDGIRATLRLTGEPLLPARNAYWIFDVFDQARALGIRTLLSGQAGNVTISYGGGDDARLPQSRWRTMGAAVLSIARRYRARIRAARLGSASPLNPDFLRDYQQGRGGETDGPDYVGPRTQADAVQRYLRPGLFTHTWSAASAIGVDFCDPTCDRRVVEFCLGIPRELYRDGRQGRMLIRRAMRGRVPDEVLDNTRRGMQSADIVLRAREEEAELREILHALDRSPLARHYLNLKGMRSTLNQLRRREDFRFSGDVSNLLLRGVLIGLFLLTFEQP